MYCDDYYVEPTEFELLMEEFKQSLLESVAEEHKKEMARLRTENAELQDFKRRKDEIEHEHCVQKHRLEWEYSQAKDKLAQARLFELMGNWSMQGWAAKQKTIRLPKCDLCDSDRLRHYTTPTGRKNTELCSCYFSTARYEPTLVRLAQVVQAKKEDRKDDSVWLIFEEDSRDDYARCQTWKNIYEDQSFDDLKGVGAVFLDKSKCEEYCAWLTANQPNKIF